jgi:hypothetical protein
MSLSANPPSEERDREREREGGRTGRGSYMPQRKESRGGSRRPPEQIRDVLSFFRIINRPPAPSGEIARAAVIEFNCKYVGVYLRDVYTAVID